MWKRIYPFVQPHVKYNSKLIYFFLIWFQKLIFEHSENYNFGAFMLNTAWNSSNFMSPKMTHCQSINKITNNIIIFSEYIYIYIYIYIYSLYVHNFSAFCFVIILITFDVLVTQIYLLSQEKSNMFGPIKWNEQGISPRNCSQKLLNRLKPSGNYMYQ
jgi:hypothetical protein